MGTAALLLVVQALFACFPMLSDLATAAAIVAVHCVAHVKIAHFVAHHGMPLWLLLTSGKQLVCGSVWFADWPGGC